MKNGIRFGFLLLAVIAAQSTFARAGGLEGGHFDKVEIEKIFGVSLAPGDSLSPHLNTVLWDTGAFQALAVMDPKTCVAAVAQETSPRENIEVIERGPLFDRQTFNVTQHAYLLARRDSSYTVFNVMIHANAVSKNSLDGARSMAWNIFEGRSRSFQSELRAARRCP